MADYYRPSGGDAGVKRTDDLVKSLAGDYGGQTGQEGALLNGLLALGYDPELIRQLADADPSRRFLDDAITRALRAGVREDDIQRALRSTRLAAEGKPQEAIAALGVTREQLPAGSLTFFDAIANRQPLPFLDRNQPGGMGAREPGAPAPGAPGAPPDFAGVPMAADVPGAQKYVRSDIKLPGQTPGVPAPGAPGGPGTGGATPGTQPFVEKLTPEQRLARIQASYGWGAAFADIPDVARILDRAANGDISPEEADRLFRASDYYKTTTKNMREWHAFQKTDPEDAKRRKQANLENIQNLARAAGIANPDMRRLEQINDLALTAGWSDADVRRALASEVRYDPTGAKTGTIAQLKTMTDEWLVPLSDEAMTSWAQSIVSGTKTIDDFAEYNRLQAKSMFPALGTALDDPEMTTKKYLDPYAQDTAELLGISANDINWRDPKYLRAFNQIDAKTNQRTIMNRADWQHTLMNDPLYGFDKTVKGQEAKQSLTQGLMSAFGFSDFG